MPEHRGRLAILVLALLALFLVVDLAVQGAGSRRIAPTTDLSAVRTEAVIEFARGLTGTAESVPTATLTSTAAADGHGTNYRHRHHHTRLPRSALCQRCHHSRQHGNETGSGIYEDMAGAE